MKNAMALIIAMFLCFRDSVCHDYFPNMYLDTGEWDGANTSTMNVFHLMFMVFAVLSRSLIERSKHKPLIFILDVIIGCLISDLVDRFIFSKVYSDGSELKTVAFIIFCVFVDFFFGKRIHEWLLNFKPYNYVFGNRTPIKQD